MNSFVVTAFVAAFAVVCVCAADLSGYCNNDETCSWAVDTSKHALTISGNAYMSNWTSAFYIPWATDEIMQEVTSVVVEEGIKSISPSAFAQFPNLETITVKGNLGYLGGSFCKGSDKVTAITFEGSIGTAASNAFTQCSGVLTVKGSIEQSYQSDYSNSGGTFYNTYFHSVSIAGSLDHIDRYSFYGSSSLISLSIGSLKSISQYAFYDNSYSGYVYGLESVTIGGLNGTIGSSAFYQMPNLTTVKLSGANIELQSNAFYKCASLTKLEISVTEEGYLGQQCFYQCQQLTTLGFSGNITIGQYAFYNCQFEVLTIPNDVYAIEGFAFAYNTNLRKLVIPASVKIIKSSAFSSCYYLSTVYFDGTHNVEGTNGFSGCSSLARVLVNPAYEDYDFCGMEIKRASSTLTSVSSTVNVGHVVLSLVMVICVLLSQW